MLQSVLVLGRGMKSSLEPGQEVFCIKRDRASRLRTYNRLELLQKWKSTVLGVEAGRGMKSFTRVRAGGALHQETIHRVSTTLKAALAIILLHTVD